MSVTSIRGGFCCLANEATDITATRLRGALLPDQFTGEGTTKSTISRDPLIRFGEANCILQSGFHAPIPIYSRTFTLIRCLAIVVLIVRVEPKCRPTCTRAFFTTRDLIPTRFLRPHDPLSRLPITCLVIGRSALHTSLRRFYTWRYFSADFQWNFGIFMG
jgi:hypothetical protein